jgi:hypothetical protein
VNWSLLDAGVALALAALLAPWIVRFNFWIYRKTGLISGTRNWQRQADQLTQAVRVGCGVAAAVFIALGAGWIRY